MVIDSSAIAAIYFDEPDAHLFAEALAAAGARSLSAVTLLEVTQVVEGRKTSVAASDIDLFIQRHRIRIVSFTPEHAEIAREAWRKYGKGNHPARLNLGDCCAYALAKLTGQPLLFKSKDFHQTDIVPAIPLR